jgi:PAS domain S-box-containing protein
MPPADKRMDQVSLGIVIAISILFLITLFGGLSFYFTQEQMIGSQVNGDLVSITRLKTDQIVAWRSERLGDAAVLSQDRLLTDSLNAYLVSPDPVNRVKILALFHQINSSYGYRNVLLTDSAGKVQLSLDPSVTALSPGLEDRLRESFLTRQAELTDLMPDPDLSSPRMYVIAPLTRTENDTDGVTGAVILVIDPRAFLYPLIQSWPVQSDTAETLLVERKDGDVLYLNDLRHQNNTALNLTIPLTNTRVPAVMAVLGTTGPFEGTDYRGVNVVSVLGPVRDSPWFIVTKVDTSEVYASWGSRSILIIALVLVSLAAFLISLWMLWQRRQKYFYRSLYSAEADLSAARERLAQQRQLALDAARLGWWHYDPVTKYSRYDRRYTEIFGVSGSERPNEELLALIHPDDLPRVWAAVEAALDPADPKPYGIEYRVNAADGVMRWVWATGMPAFEGVGDKRHASAFVGTVEDITERKRAEEVLRETNEYLRNLIDYANAPIIVWDPEFRITRFNHAFERLSGRTEQEVLGKYLSLLFPETSREASLEQIRKPLAGERWDAVEIPITHVSGETRIVLWNSANIVDSHGKIVSIIAQGQDITDRKHAEEEQARLASIVEFSDEAIIGKTIDGTIVSWNAGAERMYGYPAQEVIGRNIALLVPPSHPDDTRTILEHIRHGEPVIRYETVRRKKDGELIDVLLTVSPVRDAMNRVTGASTIAHNISHRKRAEEKIKSSEMRYRRLFESAKDGILILNRETGEILDANPFIETLLGYTPAELLGKYLWEIGIFRDTFASKAAFAKLQETEYIRYEDLPLETKEGLKIEVEFISNVYATDHTSVIQCNIRDITDRKILERQRETLIGELEQKNAELERFTYTVSHDLKSPLITIKGFAGLLEDDLHSTDPLQLKKDILRITEAADTMQELLSDLLELSRIGRIVKPPQMTEFGTIVHEAVDLLAGPLAERGVRVTIAPDLPAVSVDHARIREVMVNLLENAIKFLGDRPDPEIKVGVDRSGAMPVFFVQDNGIGIDPRYLERIFNLFEKLNVSKAGTGIGLAIVRRIIDVHGGKIWAESEGAGKGTTFRFTLPLP